MALSSKFTLIIYVMVKWPYVQGANNGLMISSYVRFENIIQTYLGDVKSKINATFTSDRQIRLRYSYITSLTADTHNGDLYFLDVQYKSIFRLDNVNIWFNNSDMSLTRLHEGISIAIGSIVFDWISQNIYWTDRYHNWISMMPVTTNDTLMFRAVVEEAVSVPVALAIDPKAGLLFWSDTQPSTRIEWSNLLGENRNVMLSGNMKFVTALTVDPDGQMLYFVDYLRETVEAVEYGGNNRTVLIRLNTYKLIDMVFYQDYICVLHQLYEGTTCLSTSGKKVSSGKVYGNPWGICVFDKSTQTTNFTDFCSDMNCAHFCVNMPTEARCVCKEGYDLQDDNTTCKAKHGISGKGLIFTNGTVICIMHITSITGSTLKPECIKANIGNGMSYLQADSNNGKIHFWNSTGNQLKTYDLLSNTTTLITFTGKNVTGLFYDWIVDDLYWSESDAGLIKVAALRKATVQITNVFTELSNPRYLTGNPHKYFLYWISDNISTGSVEIVGGAYNGSNVTTVSSRNGLHSPIGLYFDEVRNRLFWVEDDYVRSVNTDGTGAEQYIKATGANSLLKYKDHLIWTVGRNVIKAADLQYSNIPVMIDLKAYGNITGLCVFDSRIQKMERGPCEDDNGQCEHICLPSKSGPVCRCKIGYKLAPDEKMCKSDFLKNNFALLVDYTNDVIFQVPTNLSSVSTSDLVALDIPEMRSPVGVLYDYSAEYMYWTELRSQWIQKIKIGSNKVTTVFKLDIWYPDKMVIDESTGYIYYTAIRRYRSYGAISYIGILRFDPHTEQPKNKQLHKGLYEPRGIAIHPKKGLIFWSDVGAPSVYIGKCDMDGQNAVQFVTGSKVRSPIGLAIDYTEDKEYLYWADLVHNQIKRVTLDGGSFEVFYTDGSETHPSDVFVQGAYVYYISWNKRKISKLNKESAVVVNWMSDIPDLGRLDNLKIFPADMQPTNEVCGNDNGGCSAFCLLNSSNAKTCACEENVDLRSDKRTCTNVCESVIPNGMIESNCSINPGSVCGYNCNKYYRKKYQKTDKITCLTDMSWNETNLCEAIICDLSTINITNGRVESNCTGKAGIVCDYICEEGYQKIAQNSTVMCSEKAIWNTEFTGLCEEITCDLHSVNISNGEVVGGCFGNAERICNYECNSGFRKNQDLLTFNCTLNGNWNTDFNDLCTPIICDLGTINITNGRVESNCTGEAGIACDYICDEGYQKVTQNASFMCSEKATWNTEFTGLCKEITCDLHIVDILNGKVVGGCFGNVGSICNYECNTGFKKNQNLLTFNCTLNGNWNTDFNDLCTPIICDLGTINITNGRVESNCTGEAGIACDYICDEGYQKVTQNASFMCSEKATWNTEFTGLCKEITCDLHSVDILNGEVVGGCFGNAGSICNYECNTGFKKNQNLLTFNCTLNGNWNTDFNDLCTPIICDLNTINITNGRVESNCTGEAGIACDYICDEGYQKVTQNASFMCSEKATWNTEFTEFCEEITCDLHSVNILNGEVVGGCFGNVGSICNYECNSGFRKNQDLMTFNCTLNGNWNTDFVDLCTPKTCDISTINITNGRVKDGCTGTIGETCNYECDKDYLKSKTMPQTFNCSTSALWNTDFKEFCIPITCNTQESFQHGRLSVNCKGTVGESCNFTCDQGYYVNVTDIICLTNGTWSRSLKDVCQEILHTSQPFSQTSNTGVIGAVLVALLIAATLAFIICFIRFRRRKSLQQGVYKNNTNIPCPINDLRDNSYTVFDNPPELNETNDGSIQFSNPLTGVEQPPSAIYSECSNRPNSSLGATTTRGVQFSNPLCFIDDVYVSVSDKKKILADDDSDDSQAYYLKDMGENTITFNKAETDDGYENGQSES